jgi:hypothetical protein
MEEITVTLKYKKHQLIKRRVLLQLNMISILIKERFNNFLHKAKEITTVVRILFFHLAKSSFISNIKHLTKDIVKISNNLLPLIILMKHQL